MKMLTILAIVVIVAAVGMAGTITAMSLAQVAHANAGGNPNLSSKDVCGSHPEHHQPAKCVPI